jgi:hypothetical protein
MRWKKERKKNGVKWRRKISPLFRSLAITDNKLAKIQFLVVAATGSQSVVSNSGSLMADVGSDVYVVGVDSTSD